MRIASVDIIHYETLIKVVKCRYHPGEAAEL